MTKLINSTFVLQHLIIASENNLTNLVSYYHQKGSKGYLEGGKNQNLVTLKQHTRECGGTYLDSGVFTARKHNELLCLDDLINYYHRHSDEIDYVFTLDQGTYSEWIEHTRIMKEAEVPVIGIVRADMTSEQILQTVENSYDDYIALSCFGFNTASTEGASSLINYYRLLENLVGLQTKIHLLGIFKHSILVQTLPYSTDASSIARFTVFGKIIDWNEERGIIYQSRTDEISSLHYSSRARYNYRKLKQYENYLMRLRIQRGL